MKLVTTLVFLGGGFPQTFKSAGHEKQAVDQNINEVWTLPGKAFSHVSSTKWNKIDAFQELLSAQVPWNLCSSAVLKQKNMFLLLWCIRSGFVLPSSKYWLRINPHCFWQWYRSWICSLEPQSDSLNWQLSDCVTNLFFKVKTSEIIIIQKTKELVIKIIVDPRELSLTLHRTLRGEQQIFLKGYLKVRAMINLKGNQ